MPVSWDEIVMEAESPTYALGQGRTAERHSCRVKARYRLLNPLQKMEIYSQQDVYEQGWLRDRSSGGVLLETGHYLPEGKKLEVNFSSPDGSRTFRAESVIRWVKKLNPRCFHVGVQFEELHQL